MDFLNKTFKNRVTGDIFTIIDVYQNVAITSNKEKINTAILTNEKLFLPVKNNSEVLQVNDKSDDIVDPNSFLNEDKIYNTFANKIKEIPLDNLEYEESENIKQDYSDSAIIITDTEDEIEELKRKYGASSVDDSLRKQSDAFSKILNDDNEEKTEIIIDRDKKDNNISENINNAETYNLPKVEDPIITMFKNVKRVVDFEFDLKIEGKIPRLDFIEMMEDSYEASIIDFIADNFVKDILSNPNLIREKIIEKIKEMVYKKEKQKEIKKPRQKRTTTQKKVTKKVEPLTEGSEKLNYKKTPNSSKTTPVPPPPLPPNDRIIIEGQEPKKPKSLI